MRHLAFAFAALVMLGAPAFASEPARPTLRAEAIVSGDVVRIGDLVENAGIVSEVAIFRAPDLGTTGRVMVSDVLEALRVHALVGLDSNGLTEIAVTRPSRTIAAKAIESVITAALSSQYSLAEPKNIALQVERGLSAVHTEPGAGELRVSRVVFDPRSGRFDATVDFPGRAAVRKRYTGVAVATTDVITINRALARGDVIKASDIVVERRPRAEIAADIVGDPAIAVGQAARGTIAVGRTIRTADLMKPEFVVRNENVTLFFEAPGIALTGRGKAMEGGAEGDTIEVLNVQSKRTVQGVITGPGQVTVTFRQPRASRPLPQVAAQLSPQASEGAQ